METRMNWKILILMATILATGEGGRFKKWIARALAGAFPGTVLLGIETVAGEGEENEVENADEVEHASVAKGQRHDEDDGGFIIEYVLAACLAGIVLILLLFTLAYLMKMWLDKKWKAKEEVVELEEV